MQANKKAKKVLKRVVLPLYGVVAIWVIVGSIVFHEARTVDQIDPSQETFYLLKEQALKVPTGEPPEGGRTPETEVVYPKGAEIGQEFVSRWRYNIDQGYRKAEDVIPVTGHGSIIGVNLTMPLVVMNFGALVVLLWMLLWDPIIAVLDARAEKIKGNLEAASQARAEGEEAREQYIEQLRDSRAERTELIENGQRLGSEERERIIQEATEEAERMVADARRQIEIETERARAELRAELGEIAARLAGKILRREIASADHRELVRAFLKDLETGEGGSAA
jgi:F-type H+-transporting ATPase subunit b